MSLKYEEKKPFIFISYKHDELDMIVVKRTIQELRERYGFNIWYDAELTAGTNWDDIALRRVRSPFCKMVLFFASENALTSLPISNELETAKKWKKIIIPISFENKPFSDVLMQICEKYNEDMPDKVDIADSIIEKHLDDKLTYIVADINSDSYYHDIFRAVEKNAPELLEDKASVKTAASPVPEIAAPESASPAPEPVASEPVPPVPEPVVSEPVPSAPASTSKRGAQVTYTLFGNTKTSSQNELMFDAFEQAINRHPDKYQELLSLACVSDTDFTRTDPETVSSRKAQFNSCRTFTTKEGHILCVGTSYGMNDKLKLIAKLFKICGIDNSNLQIEGYALPEKVTISSGASSAASGKGSSGHGSGMGYELYGEQYSENQTLMMCRVFAETIKRHPDKRNEILDLPCVSETDYSKPENAGEIPSQFRAGRWLGEQNVYIGTAYNIAAKYKLIYQLLDLCGEPKEAFRVGV